MFFLHISNRTEQLLHQLAAVIDAGGRPNIFEKEVFLVQSQGMERIISQHLADSFKVWCNFEYHLPLSFLKTIANKLDINLDADAFDRKKTLWRIEVLLRDIDEDVYSPLSHYIQGDLADLKRFQLARQIAHIFDQYQLMRPDMLAQWQQAESVNESTTPLEGAALWQRALWQRLVALDPEKNHRGEIFAELIKVLKKLTSHSINQLPRRISVFGLHIMPPLFLEFLKELAQHIDVHLFVLSPCREYWGDVESKRSRLVRLQKYKDDGNTLENYSEEEPQQLLASLGKQGRDFQKMLVESVDFEMEFASYLDPLDEENPRLLHAIQQNLLDRGADPHRVSKDDSLTIVSCHSRFRELAVVKDYLLNLLYNDPELRLRDIVVMAPDIQEYASLIPAVFDDIQHSIADRAVRRRNTVMADFVSYLSLFSGRFGWSEVLDLLRSEHIYPQFELTEPDFDFLQKWVTESGVRWGLSAHSKKQSGLGTEALDALSSFGSEINTWVAGLRRLLLGYTMTGGVDFADITPYDDIEGGGAVALGGLCEFVSFLESRQSVYGTEHSLASWAQFLQDDAEKLFGENDENYLQELQGILAELGGHSEHKISFRVISQWLEQSASESRSSTGFLRGQLTFCSMLPMRSIPFQVVCLLGMGEGSFPKQDNFATFDLLGHNPRLGDRSPRVDDRYQFLEALISARQFLYLSYVGRSIKNNDPLPPSVVISELLDVLDASFNLSASEMVQEHPLHPFSKRYFSEDDELFSFDKKYFEIAQKLYSKEEEERAPWWSGTIESPSDTVYLSSFLGYFKNPQKYFVRNVLEINLFASESLPEETESFVAEGLDLYGLQQEYINAHLEGKERAVHLDKLARDGRWPLAGPGELSFSAVEDDLLDFVRRIESLDLAEKTGLNVDIQLGNIRLVGSMNIYGNKLLVYRYANEKGKDLLEAFLVHLIASMVTGKELTTYLVTKNETRIITGVFESQMLATYLAEFIQGSQSVSGFHVEAAYGYAVHSSKKSKKTPLQVAQEKFTGILDKGYEPETALVVGEHPEPLGDVFEEKCVQLMLPAWQAAIAE